MRAWRGLLGSLFVAAGVGIACAQTPPPLLGSIQAPYAPLQTSVRLAGTTWPAGAAAYGPVGTPLMITGSNLGGSGTVQFVAYKNGMVDASVAAVRATVTLWTPNVLVLTVPSGAMSGLITVTVEGQTSNGLPFVVTPGTYAGSCSVQAPGSQVHIATTSLHDGTVSQSYNSTLSAIGGSGSYNWSITSGTLPAGLSLSSSGIISGTPTAATGSNPSAITFRVSDTSSPPLTDEANITLTIQSSLLTPITGIYSYKVSYDAASNVTAIADATDGGTPGAASTGIMGSWSYSYDTLGRLVTGSAVWPDNTSQSLCWTYDGFGNRTMSPGANTACTPQSASTWVYNSSNQVSGVIAPGGSQPSPSPYVPDAAGDITADMTTGNQYLYDAEGRICAVATPAPLGGQPTLTGYMYDADGARVAKGAITTMSCDPTTNGFHFTENYVQGPGGEELSMLDGSNNWQRTNVYAAGKLIGTYDMANNAPALHFHLEDALGTRRMQISGMLATLGQPETDMQSLPFGDGLATYLDAFAAPTADDATPLHFTGKERDSESGNDYFGARYFASSMGRFLSPDWATKEEPVPYAKLDNPQTLNLYAYMRNNPLGGVDADGHGLDDEDPTEVAVDLVKETNEVREKVEELNERDASREAVADNAREDREVVEFNQDHPGGWDDANGCHVGPATKEQVEAFQANNREKLQNGDVAGALGGGRYSKEDLARMNQGKAPMGSDGKPIELHHEGQEANGQLKEMTQTEHRGGENFSKNHPNTGQEPSKIDRNQFRQQREQYWKSKAQQQQSQ